MYCDSFICVPCQLYIFHKYASLRDVTCSYVCPTMTHSYVCHDSFICMCALPWLIHMCVMTHSYVCHDIRICVALVFFMLSHVLLQKTACHCSSIRVSLVYICGMSHWHTCTWFIHTGSGALAECWLLCATTHPLGYDSYVFVACLITHMYLCHVSFTRVLWFILAGSPALV